MVTGAGITTCEYRGEILSFEKFLNEEGFWLADIDYLCRDNIDARKTLANSSLLNDASNILFGELFVWENTPQGHSYWRNIDIRWKQYTSRSKERSSKGYVNISYFDPFKNTNSTLKVIPEDRKAFYENTLDEFNPDQI